MKPIIPIMRTALEQIQELHKPSKGWISEREYLLYCADCGDATYPCKTRKLADAALTDRMARTNQGEIEDMNETMRGEDV